jgi:hypothetical protein
VHSGTAQAPFVSGLAFMLGVAVPPVGIAPGEANLNLAKRSK